MFFSRILAICTNHTLHLTLYPTLLFSFGNALAPIKAAEARRQEKIRLDCEVDKPGCWGGGPARGNSHTTNLSTGASQISDGSPRVIPTEEGIGVGGAGGSDVPKKGLSCKLQVVELLPHKPPEEHILEAGKKHLDQSTTADKSVAEVCHKKAEPPLRQFATGQRSSGASTSSTSSVSVPRTNRSSRAVDDIASVGLGPAKKTLIRTYNDEECARRDGNETTPRTYAVTNENVSIDREADGGRTRHSAGLQKTEHKSTVSSVGLPPDTEVFEVRF